MTLASGLTSVTCVTIPCKKQWQGQKRVMNPALDRLQPTCKGNAKSVLTSRCGASAHLDADKLANEGRVDAAHARQRVLLGECLAVHSVACVWVQSVGL